MNCEYPTTPGTFQAIALIAQQLEIFERLLEIADTTEELLLHEQEDVDDVECDRLRKLLNNRYDAFVGKYGLIRNYSSYFDGVWWIDLRLTALLGDLETISISADTGDRTFVKAEILTARQTHKSKPEIKMFIDPQQLPEQRIVSAFDWCRSYLGKIDILEIAQRTELHPDVVESTLKNLNLVYRQAESTKTFFNGK